MADVNKSVNIAINIVSDIGNKINVIGTSFNTLTGKVNIATNSIEKFRKELGKIKAPAGMDKIGKGIQLISNVNGKGVGVLADGLKKIDKVKFPDFGKVNSDLSAHNKVLKEVIKSYKELVSQSKKVKLQGIVKNVKQGSKAMKDFSTETKKSGTSFSQWGFALGSASTGLSKFGTQIYGVTRGFSAVSKELTASMLVFSTAFAGMFALKGVVSDIVQFDDAIRAAGAVAGASSTELEMFSDAAREMGESTRYTAVSAAEALKALAMTGLDVNESMATLPTVLNLAAAANMDLGQSADIVTNIMVGYGKSTKDLPRIADLMTAAFTSSNTSLQQVGVALQYVGPVAKAAGIELEETTGILASLANAGYRSSKAGTTLRTSIARLLAPTDKMRGVLDKYGIAMEQLVNEDGTMKSFTGMLDIMRTRSVTAGDALVLFGKRAGPGMLALMGQTAEEIDAMNTAISESKGIALKVAYEMESGLGGSLRKLKSMWEEVSIAIGKVIEKDVNEFVLALTKTLKDNKDELVAVTAALFRFLGVLAKVGGWVVEFVAGNARLIASLGAVAIAIRLLTVESKKLLGINLLGMFADLGKNVAWGKLLGGIRSLTVGLIGYRAAATGALGATQKLGVVNTISSGFSAAAGNIKQLGAALVGLGKSAALAITTFIRLNPWIAAITVSIGALYAITKLINKDYIKMAEGNRSAASAAKELNRELEYQLAELGLISNEYNNDSLERHARAQLRLVDVIKSANISFAEKVKLMELARSGSEGAKKAIDSLNTTLEKEKNLNDSIQLKNSIQERENLTKAIEESKFKLEELHGIISDGKSRIEEYESAGIKSLAWLTSKISITAKVEKYIRGLINSEEDLREEIEKNKLALIKSESAYERVSYQMALAGDSADDFAKKLALSGKSDEEIENLVVKYKELIEAIKDPEVKDAAQALFNMDTKEIEDAAKEVVKVYKDMDKEILESKKQSNANIAVLQAQGVLSLTNAELEKIRVYNETYQKRLTIAREKEAEIGATSEEQRRKIADAIKDIENDALSHTKEQLVKYITAEKDATEKILKIKKKQAEDEIALEEKKTGLITASANKIASLRTSLADKTRTISQKGMTDEQKNNSDRIAANNKMIAAYKLLDEYERTGDSSTLSRLQSLVGSAGDLYGNLKSSKEAYQGIGIASKTLEKIEKTRLNFELAKTEEIARKKKEKTDKELADQQKLKDASVSAIKSITDLIDSLNIKDADPNITITVDKDEVISAQEDYDELVDKTVIVTESVTDKAVWDDIKTIYDELQDKTITIDVKVKGKGASVVQDKADGGYIMPSFFAKGGDVFRKLMSPFISSGSGNKDDVPAMLMKGEYVQTTSAVRKYGTAFMDSIRSGAFPLELALSGIKGFANGGSVFSGVGSNAPTPSLSSGSNDETMSVDLNLLPNEPPISTNMSGSQVNELFRQMSIMKNRLS